MNLEIFKIFLVEDNPADVLLLREALSAQGLAAQLKVIEEGETAIQELSQMNPSDIPRLVIIDLNLPRGNGFDILRAIRGSSKFAHTRVMILTSSQSPEDRVEAQKLGADAFVSKPLRLNDFLENVGLTILRLISASSAVSLAYLALRRAKQQARRFRSGRRHARRRC